MNDDTGILRRLARRRRWSAARRVIRRLPSVGGGTERIDAILAMTVDGEGAEEESAGGHGRAGVLRFGALAAAAALVIAAAGLWTASRIPAESAPTEVELARLDAEVELVLARLGLIMQRTDRLALDDMLSAEAATNQREVTR